MGESRYKRAKLIAFVLTVQVAFILIFAFLSEYDDSAKPHWKGKPEDSPVRQYYPSKKSITFRSAYIIIIIIIVDVVVVVIVNIIIYHKNEGNVIFNDALNILFTVIWRWTYGKGPLR